MVLYYYRGQQLNEECFSHAHLPVWPIHHEHELIALQEIAGIAKLRLCELISVEAARQVNSPRLTEEVVSLGMDVASEGVLYAHLTGRSSRCVLEPSEAVFSKSTAILVTTSSYLTLDILERIARCQASGRSIGIICGRDHQELRTQVLVRSAVVFAGTKESYCRIDILPTLQIETIEIGGRLLLGALASRAVLFAALQGEADVLNIHTHSDGVDAFLRQDAVFCDIYGRDSSHRAKDSPRCVITGECHRLGTSLEHRDEEKLVHARSIRAKILIWNVCNGVLPAGGTTDTNWGFFYGLINCSTIGAVLTTWHLTIAPGRDVFEPINKSIESGRTIGKSLADAMHSDKWTDWGHRMCLFGDPDLRVAPADDDFNTEPAPLTDTQCLVIQRPNKFLSFLDNIYGLPSSPAFSWEVAALLGSSAWRDHTEIIEQVSVERESCRHALLKTIGERGQFTNDWLWMASTSPTKASDISCFRCGIAAEAREILISSKESEIRRLVICPACDLIEDVPVRYRASIHVQGRTIFLDGDFPTKDWSAIVFVRSSSRADSIIDRWPHNETGAPKSSTTIFSSWPPGLLRVSVIMVIGTEICLWSIPHRYSEPWQGKAASTGPGLRDTK